MIPTSDGIELEAELISDGNPGAFGVVLTHPHPTYGGSMHTPVPQKLFEVAASLGLPALRFNFRGVGASGGTHDGGVAERLDVVAAVEALCNEGVTSVVLAGWSFGADVALAVDDDRVAGWFAVAAPLAVVPVDEMIAGSDDRPVVLAVPEHDQFCTPDVAIERSGAWRNVSIEEIAGADHFLAGKLHLVGDLFEAATQHAVATD